MIELADGAVMFSSNMLIANLPGSFPSATDEKAYPFAIPFGFVFGRPRSDSPRGRPFMIPSGNEIALIANVEDFISLEEGSWLASCLSLGRDLACEPNVEILYGCPADNAFKGERLAGSIAVSKNLLVI